MKTFLSLYLKKGLAVIVSLLGVFGLYQKWRADRYERELERDEHEDIMQSHLASVSMSKSQKEKIEAIKNRGDKPSDIDKHFFG